MFHPCPPLPPSCLPLKKKNLQFQDVIVLGIHPLAGASVMLALLHVAWEDTTMTQITIALLTNFQNAKCLGLVHITITTLLLQSIFA